MASHPPPEESIAIEFTREERDLIREHAFISRELAEKLRFGEAAGAKIRYRLDPFEMMELIETLSQESDQTPSDALATQFDALVRKVMERMDEVMGADEGPLEAIIEQLPPELQQTVKELLEKGESLSAEEVEQTLVETSRAYLEQPQEAYEGLSQFQFSFLLSREWTAPDSPIKSNTDVTLDELKDALLLHAVRLVLEAAAETGKIRATGAGNINRKTVNAVLVRLQSAFDDVRVDKPQGMQINEQDVPEIHTARILAELGELLEHVSGHFRITEEGQRLLAAHRAGELFALVVRTVFEEFNLAYLDGLPERPEVQEYAPYFLYLLARDGGEWMDFTTLPERVFPKDLIEEMDAWSSLVSHSHLFMETRYVRPLQNLGLVRVQTEEKKYGVLGIVGIRKSPLFDRFITIDLPEKIPDEFMPQLGR